MRRPGGPRARWRARRAGLMTLRRGVRAGLVGRHDGCSRVTRCIGRLPPGLVEIYLHPAETDAFAGPRRAIRYAEEFAAPCAIPHASLRYVDLGCALGGYSDVADVPLNRSYASSCRRDIRPRWNHRDGVVIASCTAAR